MNFMNLPNTSDVAELLLPLEIETRGISSNDLMTEIFPKVQRVRDAAVALLNRLNKTSLRHAVTALNEDVVIQTLIEGATRGQDPLWFEIRTCVGRAYEILRGARADLALPSEEEIMGDLDDDNEDTPLASYLEDITIAVRQKAS
jgi:hypothetical protein